MAPRSKKKKRSGKPPKTHDIRGGLKWLFGHVISGVARGLVDVIRQIL